MSIKLTNIGESMVNNIYRQFEISNFTVDDIR